MTREEHLLTIIAEECAEIAKAASKALRFGLDNHNPQEDETNAVLMHREYLDLTTVMQMLSNESAQMRDAINKVSFPTAMVAKKNKVEHFLEYSKSVGRLTE